MKLEAKDLKVGYKQKIVAEAKQLRFCKGKLTGIIGINGSGKSTLLKTLQGSLIPLDGQVMVDNHNINNLSKFNLAKYISIVMSQSSISGALKVKEIISLGRQPYTDWLGRLSKTDEQQISKAMQLLQVEALKHQYFNQLSDGQKQRVMIARAFAQDTPFILLDEPVTHLDLYHQALVFDLLKNISHHQKKSVIFSSHQINDMIEICDELVVIQDGDIQQRTVNQWLDNNRLGHLFSDEYIVFDEQHKRFRLNRSDT
jgi:iron complex transport system ATP-binding protein